jgi:hypothetical protein
MEARRVGRNCGATWAKKIATPEAMSRLRRIDEVTLGTWVKADEAEPDAPESLVAQINEARLAIYQVIHGEIEPKPRSGVPQDERKLLFLFFDNLVDIAYHGNCSFYVGFVEGAIQQRGPARS